MAFWHRKSKTDTFVEALVSLNQSNAETTRAVLEAMTAQTQMLKDYLHLFDSPVKPEVRVMTDADEARLEAARTQAGVDAVRLRPYLGPGVDPAQWLTDTVADLRNES